MYESLMEHFTTKVSKPSKLHDTEDLESANVARGSCNTFMDDKETSASQTWRSNRKEKLIMFTCAVSSFFVAIDATILVPVLQTLAIDLDGTAAEAFWTGTSYLLTHTVFQPLIASISDIFGRRELLVPSISFFFLGSIVCAVAHNFAVMLTGRVLQGIGGAGIIALTQLIFADLVPLRQRPKYFTIVLGAWAIGTILGPVIGGLFVQHSSWRGCFWLNLPICALAFVMAVRFVTLTQPREELVTKLKSVDWIGNALFISSLTSFLVAICWAGVQYKWSSVHTICPLVLGILGLVATIFHEYRFAKHPFLKRNIFTGRSVIASYIAAAIQGLCLYMAMYYLAFYFTACLFFDPVLTGASILPASTLLIPGSVIVSALITRTGHFRPAIWVGYAISTIAAGTWIIWDEHTEDAVWIVCVCIFGLGMGMILSAVNFSIQANVAPADCGQAAAMYAFMRSVGMTLGVAIGGTTFQNVMKKKLGQLSVDDAAEIARQAEGFVVTLKAMSSVGAEGVLRQKIMDGYVTGFRGVWIVMTVFCAVGLLVSLLIQRGCLDAVLVTKFKVASKK